MNLFTLKNLTISFFILFIFSACNSHNKQNNKIPANYDIKTNLNLEGFYYGILPCASCPGIVTWLELRENDKKIKYTLRQQYLEENNALFTSKGFAKWKDNSSILELDDKNLIKREIIIGKGFVSFNNHSSQNDLYILDKTKIFSNNSETIFINPNKVKLDNKKIFFEGIINFKKIQQGGHKSLKADFILNCSTNKYSIPKISYYKNDFLTGTLLYKKDINDTILTIKNNDIISKVKKEYCQK